MRCRHMQVSFQPNPEINSGFHYQQILESYLARLQRDPRSEQCLEGF